MKNNSNFFKFIVSISLSLILLTVVYLYIRNSSLNLVRFKSNIDDLQVLIYPYNSVDKITTEFIVKKFKIIGRTSLESKLEKGIYWISLRRGGVIPILDTMHIFKDRQFYKQTIEGYRFVNANIYKYKNKKIKVAGFFFAETELSNQDYLQFCEETNHVLPFYNNDEKFNDKNQPVKGITYDDAIEYCQWLSLKTKFTCRLPYEYEWELAANKGDTSLMYPWGNFEKLKSQYLANYYPFNYLTNKLEAPDIDGFAYTSPIKSYPLYKSNFYDLSGNVFEWCLDTIKNLKEYNDFNLDKKNFSNSRIVKGGSWNFNQELMKIKSRLYCDGRIAEGNTGIRILIEGQE